MQSLLMRSLFFFPKTHKEKETGKPSAKHNASNSERAVYTGYCLFDAKSTCMLFFAAVF
jgi:hypothetical protein